MSTDAGQRASAAYSLSEMGEEALPAIPYLIAVLEDSTAVFGPTLGKTEVRVVAARTLQKMGRPAIDALLNSLKSDQQGIRCGAAFALGEIKSPQGVLPLIDVFTREGRAGARDCACTALGKIGDRRAVTVLIDGLNRAVESGDNIADICITAALVHLKDPSGIEALVSVAGKKGGTRALWALGELAGTSFRDAGAARVWWEQNKSRFK